MVFSSIPFLYYFLPAVLAVYFLTPRKGKNAVLLLASLIFYGWGELRLLPLMVFTILLCYVCGLGIERSRKRKKRWLLASIVISVGLLGVFKYADFFIGSLNAVTGLKIPLLHLALPVGISFYTFQCLSYTIDVYRGSVPAQKSLINFGAYVALFPQLIAGPIVRYADIARELDDQNSPCPALVGEVQRRLGKILSTTDLKTLYTLYDFLALPAEVICLLVSWCVEEFQRKYGPGRVPSMSQVQKEGFLWKRQGADTLEAAEQHLKRLATLRTREGEILRLLDQKPRPLVEKERKKIAAWTDMGFGDEALRLAYEKTVYKKQGMDWDYMNGILCLWHKKNLHTLAEIEAGDRPRPVRAGAAEPGRSAAPGEADARVREDLERMRAFMKKQREEGG